MLRLKELKEWFDDLSNIIVDMNIAIHNAKELNEISEDEQIEKIKKIGFFAHHKFQLHFIIVIQLSKLFSNSPQQKRRIHLLLHKLNTDEFDIYLIQQLENNKLVPTFWVDNEEIPRVFKNRDSITNEIELFNSKLKSHKEIIKKIEDSRNKIYAHSDPEIITPIPFISDVELEKMINLANDFYNTFLGRLFDVHTSFETPDWKLTWILKKLAKA
jgi:hypothetical protein